MGAEGLLLVNLCLLLFAGGVFLIWGARRVAFGFLHENSNLNTLFFLGCVLLHLLGSQGLKHLILFVNGWSFQRALYLLINLLVSGR